TATDSTIYCLPRAEDTMFTRHAIRRALSRSDNPDFESKASYSFTVVATDAANNASTRDVTLAVNNLDEVAPTITSGAVATAIDEIGRASCRVKAANTVDDGDRDNGSSTNHPA